MSTDVLIALISLGGVAVTATAGAYWGPLVKQRIERRQRTRTIRERYSPPLLQAAFDLQSRLYNIVRGEFLEAYLPDDENRLGYAQNSTLWLLAQYLGWVEILRRDAQFLDFGRTKTNRALQEALGRVTSELASDSSGDELAVFRAEQRAIGELMIVEPEGAAGSRPTVTLGYGDFVARLAEPAFDRWFDRLRRDIATLPETRSLDRLVLVQRALVDIVDLLDPDRVRYPSVDSRGRLVAPVQRSERERLEHGERLARFGAYAHEYGADDAFPTDLVEAWAERHELHVRSIPGGLAVLGNPGFLRARLVAHVYCASPRGIDGAPSRLEIYGAAEAPRWARAVRLGSARMPLGGGRRSAISRRRARRTVNDLLERLGRPPVR